MELLADVSLLPGEERIIGEFLDLNQSHVASCLHSALCIPTPCVSKVLIFSDSERCASECPY